jgi:PAS domain S-box-containing protein
MDTNLWVKKGFLQFFFIINIMMLCGFTAASVFLALPHWATIVGGICVIMSCVCSFVFALMDKAMEQMQSLRYSLDYMGDAILFTDARGEQLQFVNKKFCEVTGYSPDELRNIWPRGLWGENTDKETIEEICNAVKFKRPLQTVITSYKKDGTRYTSDVFITPVFAHGECINFISIDRLLWEEKPSVISSHPCDISNEELLIGCDVDEDLQPGLAKLPEGNEE